MGRYTGRWISTAELCSELGISERTLRRMKADGSFNAGGYFRRKTMAPHSDLLWNIDRVMSLMGATPDL